jgi:O-antigen/teichoic acid export membrane protein
MAVLSLNAVIGGFTSTKLATANRNLSMGWVTRIELLSQVAGFVFMITWALIDRSIWALVIGSLIAAIFRMLLSHFVLPGEKNRLCLEIQAFWEIFHFGKWIFLTSILGFLAMNGDRLLLGTLTDSATLGIYAIAYFVVHAIKKILSKIMGSIAFPAFSEIARERREALKTVYYKFRLPVDIATLFFTGLLFASGHLLIQLLYDERYVAAGHMLEILSIGLITARFSLDGQIYMALGKPRLLTPLLLIPVLALFGLMPLAFHTWGLNGAVWVVGVSTLLSVPITFYFRIQYNLFDLKRELMVLPMLVVGYLFGLIMNQVARIIV